MEFHGGRIGGFLTAELGGDVAVIQKRLDKEACCCITSVCVSTDVAVYNPDGK